LRSISATAIANAAVAWVARKAGVGGVSSEQAHAARIGRERARTIDERREEMRHHQSDACAKPSCHGGSPCISPQVPAHEHERGCEHAGKQQFRGIDVGDDWVFYAVVPDQEAVEHVQHRRIHRLLNDHTRGGPAKRRAARIDGRDRQ
jgi:hypothetical protein